jgi:hypothetical protein
VRVDGLKLYSPNALLPHFVKLSLYLLPGDGAAEPPPPHHRAAVGGRVDELPAKLL